VLVRTTMENPKGHLGRPLGRQSKSGGFANSPSAARPREVLRSFLLRLDGRTAILKAGSLSLSNPDTKSAAPLLPQRELDISIATYPPELSVLVLLLVEASK